MSETIQVPKWYKIVAIVAIIWNAMGAFAYIAQVTMTEEALSLLPEAERALYQNIPIWVTASFAIAVWGGLLGSVLLLLRQALSFLLLTISLVGVVIQMAYNFGMSKASEVYGPGGMVMPIMVLIFGIYLVWLARIAKTNQWFK